MSNGMSDVDDFLKQPAQHFPAEEVEDLRAQRKYYRTWAERFAAMLDAIVERPGDRAQHEEADEYIKQWYRERLEGKQS